MTRWLVAKIFNNIRLSYLDELENDPEFMSAIPELADPAWVHCKNSIDSENWTDEWARDNNILTSSANFDFKDISNVAWHIGDRSGDGTSLVRLDPAYSDVEWWPESGWDFYYHPFRKITLIISFTDLNADEKNRALLFLENNSDDSSAKNFDFKKDIIDEAI